jgi:hypothetical protein
MSGPIAPNLIKLLQLQDQASFDNQVNLNELADAVVCLFSANREAVGALLKRTDVAIRKFDLLGTIGDIVPHDSTVRDMLTTGHLAKLLARWDVLQISKDPRILGLPHPIFDQLSWTERSEYFRLGVTHDFDGDVFENPHAVEMLRHEEATLKGYS